MQDGLQQEMEHVPNVLADGNFFFELFFFIFISTFFLGLGDF